MTNKGFTYAYISPKTFWANVPYENIRKATTALRASFFPKAAARVLNINWTHIYRANHNDYTPTYRQSLIEEGVLKRPPKRRRAAVDVPTDYTEEMAAMFRLMHQAYSHVADAQIRAMFKDGK